MKPSKLSIKGVKNNGLKNSEKRKNQRTPQLETSSEGSSNVHGNSDSPQNDMLPMPMHAAHQGIQIPPVPICYKRRGSRRNPHGAKQPQKQTSRKPSERRKSSAYRGVTKCSEKRYESFVWDNDPVAAGKGGRTVYIGGFKSEIEAAIAHDLIALKIWGYPTSTNFPVSCYLKEIQEMTHMTTKECIFAIRRASQIASMFVSFPTDDDSRNEEGFLPMTQEVNGAVPNIIANEALPEEGQVHEQQNYDDELLEEHEGNFNIADAGAPVEMGARKKTVIGFTNLSFIPENPMLLGIFGQQFQAPPAELSQEINNVNLYANPFSYDQYLILAFQTALNLQLLRHIPYGPYDFGTTAIADNAGILGNENPGAGYSFGLDSTQFDSTMPNNEDFGAATPQAVVEQANDEAFLYGLDFDTNTGFQDETVVGSDSENEDDLDISQYLNLNHTEEEEEELWAKTMEDNLISSGSAVKEDGTPL